MESERHSKQQSVSEKDRSFNSSLNNSAASANGLFDQKNQSFVSNKLSEAGSPKVQPFFLSSITDNNFNATFHSQTSGSEIKEEKPTPQPIHLIYYDSEEKLFKVSEEAKEFLGSIKERVGVISVAGKYRTGKSFLLNRVIINRRNQGFGVGPTINPCTKGLWLWGDTLQGEYQGEKLKILLIDSEGIGAFDEDENHDSKIFLLALLLSSYFIYNSMGTIDENAINSLSLIINLSKELQIKSELVGEVDSDEVAKYFPSFLWVVRDFSLKLLDTFGNQLTPKEYFENAIQQQKGSSDQVETKNRIRRMIKHFFKDRDCCTLIRPVEEEKQLQSLQSMPDDQLRSEFITQVNHLRTKIYKRVKPKQLNNKYITGQMLLELCNAYTSAINTGSVPNIQNAWSYVCQNECQRAIQESINQYYLEMQQALNSAKIQCDENLLRNQHRPSRDLAILSFKSKAVGGQEISDFEILLRDGIGKKYKEVKAEFLRSCKQRALDFLETDVQRIKRNLTNQMYEDMDKVRDDLERMRTRFIEGGGPKFTGRMEIFQEIQIQLLHKAADYLTLTSRREQDQSVRRLQDKIRDMEQEKSSIKEEHRSEREKMSLRTLDLEQRLNDTLRNEKILEERLKYTQEDKTRSEASLNERLKRELEEKTERVRNAETKLNSLQTALKLREEENQKKTNEFDKLHALIDQKLSLTEKELSEYKARYLAKDQDFKDINKELFQARKENHALQNQLKDFEQLKQDELKILSTEHETLVSELQRQINEGMSGNPQVSEDQQQQWNRERQMLHEQLKSLTEGLQQQKQFQENMMKMMKLQTTVLPPSQVDGQEMQDKINKYKEKNKDLLSTNQNLSQQIVQMQSKQMNLEKDISSLKTFKYLVHCAIAIQCRSCNKLYPKNQYSQHLSACNKESERMSTLNAQQNIYPTNIQVTNCTQSKDNQFNFELQIEKHFQQWKVTKCLADFKKFFDELYSQFPSYSHIIPFIEDEWLESKDPEFYQNDLKTKLQAQLDDLSGIPFIRENSLFKNFLEFQGNYQPEEELFDYRRNGLQYNNSFIYNGHTLPSRASILNPFQSGGSQLNIGRTYSQSFVQHSCDQPDQTTRQSIQPSKPQLLTEPNASNPPIHNRMTQQHQPATNNMIPELIDDEDYTSMQSSALQNPRRMSELLDNNTFTPRSNFSRREDSSFMINNESARGLPTTYQAFGDRRMMIESNSIVEYRPSLPMPMEIMDAEDEYERDGDPIIQVVQNEEDFMDFDATHKVGKIDPNTLINETQVEGEDSFYKEIENIKISTLKDQTKECPTYSDQNSSESGSNRPSDIENTKVNLVNKFEREAVPQHLPEMPKYFKSPAHHNQQMSSQNQTPMSSARKFNQNSRYEDQTSNYEEDDEK